MLLKNSSVYKFHGCIESCLAAEGRKQCIGLFTFDDLLDDLGRDRLDIGSVGKFRIRHDCCRIRVYQHHFVSFLCKRLARLDARIVEFAPLADDDGTCADQQDFTDGSVFGHGCGKYRKRGRGFTVMEEY